MKNASKIQSKHTQVKIAANYQGLKYEFTNQCCVNIQSYD